MSSAKKRVNYTRKSLEHLRKQGYLAEVVEKWIGSYGGKDEQMKKARGFRKDLFGIIDIIAVSRLDGSLLAVQSTSKAQVTPHLKKIEQSEHIDVLRKAPWRIIVHGWHKPKHRFELVEVDVTTPTKWAKDPEPIPETGELF